MINCQKCGRANEDHYRFCLGCGARMAEQKVEATTVGPPPSKPVTPARAMLLTPSPSDSLGGSEDVPTPPSVSGGERKASTAERPAHPSRPCLVCEYMVPLSDVYCGRCGARMDSAVLKQAELILIRADGTEGRRYPLEDGENLLGRDDDAFSRDAWTSPRHARFVVKGESITVEDLGSLNGVFVRIPNAVKLLDGALVRVGLELLRFDDLTRPEPDGDARLLGSPPLEDEPWGRLARVIGPDEEADAWLLHKDEIAIGRDRGDILFPQDAFVSGSHARLKRASDGCVLEDLGSSNGTYLKIPGRWELRDSDVLLLGQQIVRLSLR